jgi:hypothetical protein
LEVEERTSVKMKEELRELVVWKRQRCLERQQGVVWDIDSSVLSGIKTAGDNSSRTGAVRAGASY